MRLLSAALLPWLPVAGQSGAWNEPGARNEPDSGNEPGAWNEPGEPSTLPGEAFAQGSEAGTQAAASVAPAFFGDQIGTIPAQGNIFVPPTSRGL